MTLSIFNTETRKKERLQVNDGELFRMYTCGPTIYDYAHIGNFRTYVFEDLLRRTLKFTGTNLCHVMNITDIDDKTIKGAIREGLSLKDYTAPYLQAFFEDLDALSIERAEHYPAATDYIAEMIAFIESLIEKGFAYQGKEGSVYFSIKKSERYGVLSHFKLDELQEGASERQTNDEYDKDNVADFVLWKAYDAQRDGQIYWDSPFGLGRPGWHIECSTMAIQLLGESIDLHVGGVDNIFPHHENEIAQSEACTGKQFVRYWMHSEHLIVENKKMSKSLNNFFTLRDLLEKGYTGRQVRYVLLQTHYRTQLNFTFESLDAAKASMQRLDDFVYRLKEVKEGEGEVDGLIKKVRKEFTDALCDDLNISVALAALFDFVRDVNSLLDQGAVGELGSANVLQCLGDFNQVIALFSFDEESSIPLEFEGLLEQRQAARAAKDWALADQLRNQIEAAGFVIEDSPTGSRLKKV